MFGTVLVLQFFNCVYVDDVCNQFNHKVVSNTLYIVHNCNTLFYDIDCDFCAHWTDASRLAISFVMTIGLNRLPSLEGTQRSENYWKETSCDCCCNFYNFEYTSRWRRV